MQTPAKDIYIGFNLKVLPGPRGVRGGPSWRSAIQFSESDFRRRTGEARRLFVHDGRGVNAIFPGLVLLLRTGRSSSRFGWS